MDIKITRDAYKTLKRWPKITKDKIVNMVINPPENSCHKYVGQYPDMFVIKHGEYRIICRKLNDAIIVEFCGVRGDVYKRSRRKLGNHISA